MLEQRLTLAINWAQQSADFMKVSVSDYMIQRCRDSVALLTDAEVAEYVSELN